MAKPLYVIILAILLGCAPAASAAVWLVSVGIADYPGTKNDLPTPVRDAKGVEDVFQQNTHCYAVLLTNSKATKQNIIQAMRRVYAKAKPNDIVVLAYSGHGYPGGFVAYDGYLTYEQVRAAMAKSQSRHKMILANACFAGAFPNAKKDPNAARRAKAANVMLFLSSRYNEYSWAAGSGMTYSYFTNYLIEGLSGSADANGDKTVTARELYEYVHPRVINAMDGQQHPVMWGNFSNNMPVIKLDAK